MIEHHPYCDNWREFISKVERPATPCICDRIHMDTTNER